VLPSRDRQGAGALLPNMRKLKLNKTSLHKGKIKILLLEGVH
jgi:hypothetical protein